MNDQETEYEEIDEMKQIACNALNNDNCPECGDDRCGMCRRIARMFKQAGYRKADKLIAEIAGLTGKVEALQQDNENLRRTLEESREGEKPKMRENELHEPKIKTEIKAAEGYSTVYYVSACCPVCDFFLGKSLGLSKEQVIDEVKQGSIYNYCPQCGALLKEESE